ncbi:MAG: NAD-dependent epimerase/dehydratase family protein [Sulfuricurvum sp.]
MKLLLTGSTGFIGSHFTHLTHPFTLVPFSFTEGDIDALYLGGIDAIVHLGALVHQMDGAETERYEAINVTRTIELALKAKQSGVRKFLFMSSVKVYGEESDEPYTETSLCCPQDEYGKSKFRAEQELFALSDGHFVVSVIRTPVVYGSGVKGNIKSLIDWIRGPAVFPFHDTRNLRSMVYVGNLCALMKAVLHDEQGGVFLASDDRPISTTEFIRQIAVAMEKKPLFIPVPFFESILRALKPALHQRLFGNLYVDNRETRSRLNFHNPFTIEEGIAMMIKGDDDAQTGF